MTQFTDEQQHIIAAAKQRTHNIAVDARPGAGKTTLLVGIANAMPSVPGIAITFMKRNAEDLKARMPEWVRCSNINSLGNSLLIGHFGKFRRDAMNGYKYGNMAKQYLINLGYAEDSDLLELHSKSIERIVRITRAHMLLTDLTGKRGLLPGDFDKIAETCEKYDIEANDAFIELAPQFISEGLDRIAFGTWDAMKLPKWKEYEKDKLGFVDFDDQIYAPLALGMKPDTMYDVVYIDEAQDLTRAKLLASLMWGKSNATVISAGDPFQSLMGFSGADTNSFGMVVEQTGAKIMPMTKTFRFGENIANQVKNIAAINVKDNGATPGVVYEVDSDKLLELYDNETAVISRWTKRILSAGFDAFSAGKQVIFPGNEDLGKRIMAIIRKVENAKDGPLAYGELLSAVSRYKVARTRWMKRHFCDPTDIQAFSDLCDCAMAALNRTHFTNTVALERHLDTVFGNKTGTSFMTVHKAKGGEWKRVVILQPADFWQGETLPPTSNPGYKFSAEIKPWAIKEEINIWFVAATRARHELVLVPVFDEKDLQIDGTPENAITDAEIEAAQPVRQMSLLETLNHVSSVSQPKTLLQRLADADLDFEDDYEN